MFLFGVLSVAQAAVCPAASITEFDIHGEVKILRTNEEGWAYFGAGFGDFGHTVQVRIWGLHDNKNITKFYYTYDHSCPTEASKAADSSKLFLEGGTSQYAIFGVPSEPNTDLVVSIASTVRPIHPHSTTTVIYGILIFFGVNFVITGVLQYLYFNTAMNPNEYKLADE